MADDLAARLALIAAHAPRLRNAGVQHLTIDGVTMTLAPPDPPPPEVTEDKAPKSMLDDTASYGLPEGADVPGFRRPDDLPRG